MMLSEFLNGATDDLRNDLKKGLFSTFADVERWVDETIDGSEYIIYPQKGLRLLIDSDYPRPDDGDWSKAAAELMHNELGLIALRLWEQYLETNAEETEDEV